MKTRVLLNSKVKFMKVATEIFSYSRIKHEVFTIPKKTADKVTAKVELQTKIFRLNELTLEH